MLGSVYFSVRKHAGLRFYNSCRKRFYRSMYFAVELQMYTRASFFDCTTYCRALSNTSWDMYYFEHLHFILKIINDTIYLQYLIVKILSWLQNCIKIIDEIKKPWYNISIEEYIYIERVWQIWSGGVTSICIFTRGTDIDLVFSVIRTRVFVEVRSISNFLKSGSPFFVLRQAGPEHPSSGNACSSPACLSRKYNIWLHPRKERAAYERKSAGYSHSGKNIKLRNDIKSRKGGTVHENQNV